MKFDKDGNSFGKKSDKYNKIVTNSLKIYVILLVGLVILFFYTRAWLPDYVLLLAVAVLFALPAYYAVSRSAQKELQAEDKLRLEEAKRQDLEREMEARTSELRQKNKELEEKNELLADRIYLDMNLGLYNIRYLQENLGAWNEESPLSLLIIDIRGFKNINSLFGYATGDKVLAIVARRLRECYGAEGTLFRLYSNKFGLLFRQELSQSELLSNIQKIHALSESPVEIGEINIRINFSIGAATYQQKTADIHKILENAEYAEREASILVEEKAYQIFDHQIAQKVEREQTIRSLLEQIDFDQEFELHYQPQCDVQGNLLGMEALLRWSNPVLGRIAPAEFIPIAEGSAAIFKITRWTLRKGIEQVKKWNTKYQTNYRVGINISTRFIENTRFLTYVQEIIAEYQVPPQWLDLEITETSLINISSDIVALFEKLSEMGVSISLDDFGTGYSSLSYINSFQISNIKIAKELVDEIVDDPKESALVKAIIMMGQSLQVDIIAEGVEQKNQLQTLADLGCDKIQGYYFGKPQSSGDFEKNFIMEDSRQ